MVAENEIMVMSERGHLGRITVSTLLCGLPAFAEATAGRDDGFVRQSLGVGGETRAPAHIVKHIRIDTACIGCVRTSVVLGEEFPHGGIRGKQRPVRSAPEGTSRVVQDRRRG